MKKTRLILLFICIFFFATSSVFAFPLFGDKRPQWLLPLLSILSLASVFLIVVSIFALPFILSRLYKAKSQADISDASQQDNSAWSKTFWHIFLKVTRNFIGGILILAGIAMLVLPGQGLLTLFIGIALVDFPGKKAMARKLRNYKFVAKVESALRDKYGGSGDGQAAKVDTALGESGDTDPINK